MALKDIATEEFALIEESNMSLRRESLEHVELNEEDTLQGILFLNFV